MRSFEWKNTKRYKTPKMVKQKSKLLGGNYVVTVKVISYVKNKGSVIKSKHLYNNNIQILSKNVVQKI